MLVSRSSKILTAEEMRKLDSETIEKYGISGQILMENAGRSCVAAIKEHFPPSGKRVVVFCGPGNNGGDGFVIARYLFMECESLTLVKISGKGTDDSEYHYNAAIRSGIGNFSGSRIMDAEPASESRVKDEIKEVILSADIIIDAIFGTGLKSAPRGIFSEIIDLVNLNEEADVVSVDIPSGLDTDTGLAHGSVVNADITVTFGFMKPAHCLEPGRTFSGSVLVADIGLPPVLSSKAGGRINLMVKQDIAKLVPVRKTTAHKGELGHLVVIGGSIDKPGAAVMTARAAHRAGAGLVSLVAPDGMDVSSLYPETMRKMVPSEKGEISPSSIESILKFTEGKSAVAVGPGLGTGKGPSMLIESLLKETELPLLLDADALNIISENPDILKSAKKTIVLTPHPGEMARLSSASVSDILNDKLKVATLYSGENNVVLVLKGADTVIAEPLRSDNEGDDVNIWINTTGNPGLACGGSGDVLSGIISAFMANGLEGSSAARLGVFMHGMAADLLHEKKGGYGYLPTEVAEILPETLKILKNGNIY